VRALLLAVVGSLGFFYLVGSACAQTGDDSEKSAKAKVEMLKAKVRVVDPDDNPIEGATVRPGGLQARAVRGTHWFWTPTAFGEPPKLKTDADGMVEMPYPKYVKEKLETGQMTWTVTHPDFILFRDDFSVDVDPAEIKMKRGFKIAVSAVDGKTGKRLTEDLYAVVGRGVTWKLTTNGTLVSTTMPKTKRFLRVVELNEGQPARYSERIEVKPEDKSRVLIKDAKVSRGTRVVGKLDENVSRPVNNGYVVAQIGFQPSGDPNNWNGYWVWSDRVEIQEDGTFVFESLPSDEVLQMIPVCDGWIPKTPKPAEVAKFFPNETGRLGRWAAVPQPIKLEGDEVEATLKMVKARKVRVTVVGPDDQPIVGANVGCSPNQKWFLGGSQIYGEGYVLTKHLVEEREGGAPSYTPSNPYSSVTDEDGIAEMGNLPANCKSGYLLISHDDFELPVVARERVFEYEFADSGVTEVTVKLQKKGTEVIDGS